jgi:cell shape-determining protein MreC
MVREFIPKDERKILSKRGAKITERSKLEHENTQNRSFIWIRKKEAFKFIVARNTDYSPSSILIQIYLHQASQKHPEGGCSLSDLAFQGMRQ